MPGTFEDQAQLAQLFQQSLSPINTSGQNILALALQERQARDAAARQQEQSALLLSREQEMEKIRQAGENERAKNANAAVLERLRQEYALKDKAQQETERRTMVEKANQVGANLPKDASYEAASAAYVDAHGRSYIEANKRAGVALSGVLRATNMDPSVVSSRVANLIADDPAVAKTLTIQEREQIRNNPGKLIDFRKQFASSPKKYEAFTQAMTQASSTVTTELEKEAASKPEAIRATAELRMATDTIKELQKQAPFDPKTDALAFEEFSKAAHPPPPPPPRQPNFGLPTARTAAPAVGAPVPTAAPAAAGQASPFQDFLYNVGPAAPGLLAPTSNLNAPAPVTFQAPRLAAPIAQPAIPTDPSVLSTLRLRKFLQDSAANNNSLFPTAYPTPDLLSPTTP